MISNEGFYTEIELKQIGFKSIGENVLISKKCSIYGEQNISIGNRVRIDDYCILVGNITIGD
jgi:dTDP-4-amino-4,6-dideoxy-D-glucose acyltransferase